MAKAVRDEVLTTAETCRYLKVAPRTLYRYIQEKRVPAFKLGKDWRFVKSEIDKAGRILIPGKLRKHINLADDQEIVLVGMYEHFEIWEPADWRRYLAQTENRHEDSMSKIMDLL